MKAGMQGMDGFSNGIMAGSMVADAISAPFVAAFSPNTQHQQTTISTFSNISEDTKYV